MAFGRTGVAAGTYQSVKVDTYGRVLSASNPTTVAGYGLTDVYTRNEVDQVMLLKAPVANPVFEGVPKVPTAAVGDNSMQAASTAYVIRAINALVNAAPGTLDTLKELADALGNDPSFATTVANSLALKAPLASPAFSGIPLVPTATTGNKSKQAINSEFLRATLDKYGLGATQTGDVSSAAQLPTLPSGHYYYDSSFSPYGVMHLFSVLRTTGQLASKWRIFHMRTEYLQGQAMLMAPGGYLSSWRNSIAPPSSAFLWHPLLPQVPTANSWPRLLLCRQRWGTG